MSERSKELVARYGNVTLISADTIGRLRSIDVLRVVEQAVYVSDVDAVDYARWIKEERAGDHSDDVLVRRAVDESLIELGLEERV